MTTSIERADARDTEAIESLLRANDLPLDGLSGGLRLAVVARDAGPAITTLVGCAAIERYGHSGLLRSVCVATPLRGSGLGSRLVAEAERLAAESGIDELYLLTETAVDLFPRLGYVPAARADAPADMAASPEFASACPVSAAVFWKSLPAATPRS